MKFAVDYSETPYIREGDLPGFNWLSWRSELILARNRSKIKGKRVLDLASRDGHLAYACLQLGAQSVTGVEVRQESIDAGKEYISGTEFEPRMKFVHSEVFDFLEKTSPEDFDVILCLGFLYHTVRQVQFFRECERLKPSAIFICSSVAKNYFWFGKQMFGKPPALFLNPYEDPKLPQNTIDADGIVLWPSTSFLEEMFRKIGYEYRQIKFSGSEIRDWRGLEVYKKGTRAAYVATRVF